MAARRRAARSSLTQGLLADLLCAAVPALLVSCWRALATGTSATP